MEQQEYFDKANRLNEVPASCRKCNSLRRMIVQYYDNMNKKWVQESSLIYCNSNFKCLQKFINEEPLIEKHEDQE